MVKSLQAAGKELQTLEKESRGYSRAGHVTLWSRGSSSKNYPSGSDVNSQQIKIRIKADIFKSKFLFSFSLFCWSLICWCSCVKMFPLDGAKRRLIFKRNKTEHAWRWKICSAQFGKKKGSSSSIWASASITARRLSKIKTFIRYSLIYSLLCSKLSL